MVRSANGIVETPGKNVAAKSELNRAILDKARTIPRAARGGPREPRASGPKECVTKQGEPGAGRHHVLPIGAKAKFGAPSSENGF
jgi:hypothetical protein